MNIGIQLLVAVAVAVALWVALRKRSPQQKQAEGLAAQAERQGWRVIQSADGCLGINGRAEDGRAWQMVVDVAGDTDGSPDVLWWETVAGPCELAAALRAGAMWSGGSRPETWVGQFLLPGHLTSWQEHGLRPNPSVDSAIDAFARHAATVPVVRADWQGRVHAAATDPGLASALLNDAEVGRHVSDLLAVVAARMSWGLQAWVGAGLVRVRVALAVGGIETMTPVIALGEALAAVVRRTRGQSAHVRGADSTPEHGGRR